MEDYREDFVVVAAGYPDEMTQFVNSNPGLASRFTDTLTFPDYSDAELEDIFYRLADSAGVRMDPDAIQSLRKTIPLLRRQVDFANGRSVRTLFDRVMKAQAKRLVKLSPSADELSTVCAQDVQLVASSYE